jgi:hypothetical protein
VIVSLSLVSDEEAKKSGGSGFKRLRKKGRGEDLSLSPDQATAGEDLSKSLFADDGE